LFQGDLGLSAAGRVARASHVVMFSVARSKIPLFAGVTLL
jgi:hypothetical protein